MARTVAADFRPVAVCARSSVSIFAPRSTTSGTGISSGAAGSTERVRRHRGGRVGVDAQPDHPAPYPTKFGLWRAPASPVAFLFITNRLVVVGWADSDGLQRTLLWEPSDTELDDNTPYFSALVRMAPGPLRGQMVTTYGTVAHRLAEVGIDPADVDY